MEVVLLRYSLRRVHSRSKMVLTPSGQWNNRAASQGRIQDDVKYKNEYSEYRPNFFKFSSDFHWWSIPLLVPSWKSEHIPKAPFSRIFYSLIHNSASLTFPLVFIDNWSSFVVCSRHENRSACLQLRYRIYSIPLFTINYRLKINSDYIYFLIFTSISC